jgi:histone-lysine N-methyltransferase SETMAR
MNFDRQGIRKLIYYCWKRGLTTADIKKEINNTLGDGSVSLRTCSEWVSKFQVGDIEVTEKPRCGRPSHEVKDQIQAVLDENHHATVREISQQIGVHRETVRTNLLKMGKCYLLTAWIPYSLSDDAKLKRVAICQELLQLNQQNAFLHQLITSDESWVFWENSGSKHHRAWRGSGDEPVTETTQCLTNKKHLATIFWDCKGAILMDVLPCGETMNAVYYCGLLEKLKDAMQEKRRRRMSDGCLYLLHDNARPHTALATKEKLANLHLNIVPHPPYSPDLAPSDFYLFSPMKSALKGRNFNCSEDVQRELQSWFDSKPLEFFATGINKLPGRWQRCIEHAGSYFEHLDKLEE